MGLLSAFWGLLILCAPSVLICVVRHEGHWGQGWGARPWHQHHAACVPKVETGANLPPRGGLGQIPQGQAPGLLTFV